jgi:hypothetical protein
MFSSCSQGLIGIKSGPAAIMEDSALAGTAEFEDLFAKMPL